MLREMKAYPSLCEQHRMSLQPVEVDFCILYVCSMTRTGSLFYLLICSRGSWFPYSKCPCLRGPDPLLEYLYCSRGPDYLLEKPLEVLFPSSGRPWLQGPDSFLVVPLSLEVLTPSSRCHHLWGLVYLLKHAFDFEVPFSPRCTSCPQELTPLWHPWSQGFCFSPQDASWGLKMPFSPEVLILSLEILCLQGLVFLLKAPFSMRSLSFSKVPSSLT